jgi:tRNA threonylcarbamoyladenosine modification (KEOPS) complex  Pcc1 subunit
VTGEVHVNGRIEVELSATDAIERTVFDEMASRAERGQVITLERRGEALVVAVQK